jgi:centrosomal protein CEP104
VGVRSEKEGPFFGEGDKGEEEVGEEGEEEEEEGEEEEKTCQFCGLHDPGFTEEALDRHYFTSCPLLMRCRECGQVIEIFGLPEHLLEECEEARGEYEACRASGLAVRRDQWEAWRTGPGAYFAEEGGKGAGTKVVCPLCFYAIEPASEEGVRAHYITRCPRNARREEMER